MANPQDQSQVDKDKKASKCVVDTTIPIGDTIPQTDIKYLVFEGGGGKDSAYLGAIKALESRDVLPINGRDSSFFGTETDSQVKGVSGASAGAINALMVALGVSSADVEELLDRNLEINGVVQSRNDKPKSNPASVFDAFFDYPKVNMTTVPSAIGRTKQYFDQRTVTYDSVTEKFEAGLETTCVGFNKNRTLLNTTLATAGRLFNVDELDPALNKLFDYYDSGKPFVNARFGSRKKQGPITGYLLDSLYFKKGLLSGIGVRKFMHGLIQEYFLDRLSTRYPNAPGFEDLETQELTPVDVTFELFYYITGVDLVVVGTNITEGRPQYFSKSETPKFPIAEAIAISMNIPVMFKPIKVLGDSKIAGEYVDGGMLTNLPLHAFDEENNANIPHGVLGFRLEDGFPAGSTSKYCDCEEEEEEEETGICEGKFTLLTLVGQMMGAFMYGSENGQIRTNREKNAVIKLPSFCLTTTNFTPSAEIKKEAIDFAEAQTLKYLNAPFNAVRQGINNQSSGSSGNSNGQ